MGPQRVVDEFVKMDFMGSGCIDNQHFRDFLSSFRIVINDEDAKKMCNMFTNGKGQIEYLPFLKGIGIIDEQKAFTMQKWLDDKNKISIVDEFATLLRQYASSERIVV